MVEVTGFWNSLAVRDLERARAFYAALGFTVEDMPVPGGITVRPDGDSQLCLFLPEAFAGMIPGEVCDAVHAQEIVQSISVETREAVSELVETAAKMGGRALGNAAEQPFGYAGGFADPDGHVWAVLWFRTGSAAGAESDRKAGRPIGVG